jgi:hypothetical protein
MLISARMRRCLNEVFANCGIIEDTPLPILLARQRGFSNSAH